MDIMGIGTQNSLSPLIATNARWSDEPFNVHQFSVVNGSARIDLVRGDFNHNWRVDVGDVSLVAYMVVGRASILLPDADFNNNGIVDIGDAAKIAWFQVGKIPEL